MRRSVLLLRCLIAAAGISIAGAAMLAFGRPPQPLALGAKQQLYEGSLTVTAVSRGRTVGKVTAAGEFYIVDVLAEAPYGLRPTWDDSRVHVETFAGSGRTTRGGRYEVDAGAQRILDRITGRPGPVHEIRGAASHERLVFDLPLDVEQPGLVFDDANDPWNFLDILFGRVWQPHRFNLRYD